MVRKLCYLVGVLGLVLSMTPNLQAHPRTNVTTVTIRMPYYETITVWPAAWDSCSDPWPCPYNISGPEAIITLHGNSDHDVFLDAGGGCKQSIYVGDAGTISFQGTANNYQCSDFSLSGNTVTYLEYIPLPEVTFDLKCSEQVTLWKAWDWAISLPAGGDTLSLRDSDEYWLDDGKGRKQAFTVDHGAVTLGGVMGHSSPNYSISGNTITYQSPFCADVSFVMPAGVGIEIWTADWNYLGAVFGPSATFALRSDSDAGYFLWTWYEGKARKQCFNFTADGEIEFYPTNPVSGDTECSSTLYTIVGPTTIGFAQCTTPAVVCDLVPTGQGGFYKVQYSATAICTITSLVADIDGVSVTDGQLVKITHSNTNSVKTNRMTGFGGTHINTNGPGTLTVTATTGAGSTVCTDTSAPTP